MNGADVVARILEREGGPARRSRISRVWPSPGFGRSAGSESGPKLRCSMTIGPQRLRIGSGLLTPVRARPLPRRT